MQIYQNQTRRTTLKNAIFGYSTPLINSYIKAVDINIFRGNVSTSGFYAKPTEVHFSAFAKGETKEDVLLQLLVSKASISGLVLFDLIISKELMIDFNEISRTINTIVYRFRNGNVLE